MALNEQFLEEEIHPIDIVEHIAEHHEWEFDRIEENQIAMAVEAQWRTYSLTLAWSGFDETPTVALHVSRIRRTSPDGILTIAYLSSRPIKTP